MAKDRSKKLEDLVNRARDAERATNQWKPEKPGDVLCGTVSRLRWLKSDSKDDDGKFNKYLSVVIADENGELVFHNCGVVLQEEFLTQKVEPGDDVAICYKGQDGRTGLYTLATSKKT